jgi:hypothetical protein
MKTRVFLITLGAGLLVGGYPNVRSVQAEPLVPAVQLQWQQFSSTEGGFKVLMPVKPSQKRQSTDNPNMPLDANLFTASVEEGKVNYSVSYTNLPEEIGQYPANIILDSLSSRFTTDRKIKLLDQKDISLGRYLGKEFKFEAPGEVLVNYRVYLVEKRLYQVIREIPKSREGSLASDLERFLSSFQLLEKH